MRNWVIYDRLLLSNNVLQGKCWTQFESSKQTMG